VAIAHLTWETALVLAVLLLAAGLMTRYGTRLLPARRVVVLSGQTMGTYYRVSFIPRTRRDDATTLHREIQAALERVEALMSTYRPDSELSRFNASPSTDWVPVAPEVAAVVALAVEVGQQSSARYDITIGPLVNLWSFGPDRRPARPPSDEELAQARARVGLERLAVRSTPPALRKTHADLYVDLASVAKGFGVDQVAELLERCAVRDYCVDIGGEVRARGRNARRVPWQVAIEEPAAGSSAAARIVPLADRALATSGDYRNYFEEHGVRYSHLLDPRTGRPLQHALGSVTVVDRSCARADAWATALFVAGPDEGYTLAVQHHLPAVFISRTHRGFSATYTPAMAALL
jgi:thiamine biosynthesis lipoprotein